MSRITADQRLADFQAIPVIDISGLLHGDAAARQAVADNLGRAARDVGFFQMVGHGIDLPLREGLITQAKRFFAQPETIKMERYIGLYHHHRGYVPPGEESPDPNRPDMKEAFDLAFELPSDDPEVLAGTPLLGPNPGPTLTVSASLSPPTTRLPTKWAGHSWAPLPEHWVLMSSSYCATSPSHPANCD